MRFAAVLGIVSALAVLEPAAKADPGVSYRQRVLDDRPVAYYRLDEQSGSIAHDSSGHGYDGVIGAHVRKGAPPLIADARASMEFNGADKSAASEDIRVKGRPGFAIEKNLSIEAWVLAYTTSVFGNNAGDVSIVAYGEDTDPDNQHCRYALELDAHSHLWHFPAVIYGRLLDNEVTGVRSFFTMIGNSVFPHLLAHELYAADGTVGNPAVARRLYYLAGTYDGETMRFFIDGKLNNVRHVSGRISGFKATNGLGIGGEFVNVNAVLHGRISEVAIYDHVLSPERIEAHYLAGIAGNPSSVSPRQRRP